MGEGGLYDMIWNEGLWFPANLKVENSNRTFGWKDLENTADSINYYPQIRDLNLGIVLGVVFVGIRFLLDKFVFIPLGYWLGIKRRRPINLEPNSKLEQAYKQNKDIDKETAQGLSKKLDIPVHKVIQWFHKRKRVEKTPLIEKFCNNSWHLLFYTISFTYGCVILWSKPWLWKTKESWNGWPTQHVSEDLYWYYIVELAFYGSLILTLFTDHRRKDFKEMIFHHIVTIVLIYFSWVTNFVRIGSLVLVLHDASDPWLAIAKMGLYFKKKNLTDSCFSMFVLSWTIPRILYFPLCVLNSTLFEVLDYWNSFSFAYYFFNTFLFMLFMLHLVWTHRLFKLVCVTLSGEEVKDTRSDDEESSEESDEKPSKNGHSNGVTHTNGKQNGSIGGDHSNGTIANGHAT